MSGLMGDWRCKPVMERGIYAVYMKGDIDALKERNAELVERVRKVVHENALLNAEVDRLRHAVRYKEDDEWMNL